MLPFQANPMGDSNPKSALNVPTSYIGGFRFGKNTISWGDKTVLRQNISSVYMYNIERSFKVNNMAMVLMAVGILLSLLLGKLWPIVAIPCGLILIYGALERLKPRLYGLTLEMNSGAHKNIYSADESGIKALYRAITDALESDEKVFNAHFGKDAIKIDNMQNITNTVIGSNGVQINNHSTGNSNSGDLSGKFTQLHENLTKRGMDTDDIMELKAILAVEQQAHLQQKLGPLTDMWTKRMEHKYTKGMGKDITAGLLVNLLSHFFGWS